VYREELARCEALADQTDTKPKSKLKPRTAEKTPQFVKTKSGKEFYYKGGQIPRHVLLQTTMSNAKRPPAQTMADKNGPASMSVCAAPPSQVSALKRDALSVQGVPSAIAMSSSRPPSFAKTTAKIGSRSPDARAADASLKLTSKQSSMKNATINASSGIPEMKMEEGSEALSNSPFSMQLE